MARRNRSRYTVLACLSVRSMSGYDIKQFIENNVAYFWSESYGQIYPTLKSLEAEGLVVGRNEEGDGRRRRVYTLTGSGLGALRQWLAEPLEPDVPRYEISLKLFFADQLPIEVTLEHLTIHRARHAAMLQLYRSKEGELRERFGDSPRFPYWLTVLRGGIRYAEMVVAWCDDTAAELRSLDPDDYPAEPSAPVADN